MFDTILWHFKIIVGNCTNLSFRGTSVTKENMLRDYACAFQRVFTPLRSYNSINTLSSWIVLLCFSSSVFAIYQNHNRCFGKTLDLCTVFAEISAHQKQWFFKGGSTQNRWPLMGDFWKGGVHKTDGFCWMIFERGEYTKPMTFDGWFFKGGVHKTDGFWWVIFQRGEYTKPMAFGMFFCCF